MGIMRDLLAWRREVADGRLARPAVSNLVCWIGTSSVAFGVEDSAAGINFRADKNWLGWTHTLCPQVRLERSYVFDFGALTSREMLAALPAMEALNPVPGIVMLQSPANDFPMLPIAESKANVREIAQRMLKRGSVVCIVTQHPRSTTQTDSAARAYALEQMREAEQMQVTTPGCLWLNAGAPIVDRTVSGYTYVAGTIDDGLHLNELGAYLVASEVFAPLLNSLVPSHWYVAESDQDIFSASNIYGSFTNNPTLLGTTGTVGAGMAPGQVATGYTASNTIPGLTVTPSKLVEGRRTWQRFAFAGTPTGSGYFQFDASAIAAGLAGMVGRDVILEILYRVVAGPGGAAAGAPVIRGRFTRNEGGQSIIHRTQAAQGTAVAVPHEHRGVLRTRRATIIQQPTSITDTKLYLQPAAAFPLHDFYLDVGGFSTHAVPPLAA